MIPLHQSVFSQPLLALGPDFYSEVRPAPLADPQLVAWNTALAGELGLPAADGRAPATVEMLSGNCVPDGVIPVATVYAGHQFGHFAGQLGDGRAILLGELQGFEVQLKGAGETPYSRRGDGRAVLRSTIREYLCSEAMHGLGIPTTRALALVASPQTVWREQAETAAVLTRLAPSHLRFGHFENFYWRGNVPMLKKLADYVIARYYPALAEEPVPCQALLEAVVARTADLIARWQGVGFCHGVMNSDNMSILGLTLDYGPFGFLDGFDAAYVCNHSDEQGRYAYNQQPGIGLFNLQCLAQALQPLLDRDAVLTALQGYAAAFKTAYATVFRAKLGLQVLEVEDAVLWDDLLVLLQAEHTDWTIFWRRLSAFSSDSGEENAPVRDMFVDRGRFDAWAQRYATRLQRDGRAEVLRHKAMRTVNPKYVLRNHLAEQAIRAAQEGDFREIDRLHRVLSSPFEDQPEFEGYAAFPPDWASDISVSCSS